MHSNPHIPLASSRRDFLRRSACGFGSVAMAALLAREAQADTGPLAVKLLHLAPKSKTHYLSRDLRRSIAHGHV